MSESIYGCPDSPRLHSALSQTYFANLRNSKVDSLNINNNNNQNENNNNSNNHNLSSNSTSGLTNSNSSSASVTSPSSLFTKSSSNNNNNNSSKCGQDYTIAGRTQQNSRFSKFYYRQVGTFLTQYKIRENYKFLQMISVPPLDPAVPRPEGGTSVPACGEPLLVPQSFPQSLEAAIHKFANASSKATCITVLDQNGKPSNSLTYGKCIKD